MSLQQTRNYIDKRLATIDTMPETWGSPESLELQALLLLELSVAVGAMDPAGAAAWVRLQFVRFVRSTVEDASAELLWLQLQRRGRAAELPSLLGKFRDQIHAAQQRLL